MHEESLPLLVRQDMRIRVKRKHRMIMIKMSTEVVSDTVFAIAVSLED